MPSENLILAVAATAELCGRTLTQAAARIFVDDLSGFPEHQVLGALRRCRMEVRGALTVQDVVSRLDDGRPGPDEAWALVPKDEAGSTVWTDEVAAAYAAAAPLLDAGDKVGARFAFREAYTRAVTAARDKRQPARWWPSLGHDQASRESAINHAADLGRISIEYARAFAPELPAPRGEVAALLANTTKRLQGNTAP